MSVELRRLGFIRPTGRGGGSLGFGGVRGGGTGTLAAGEVSLTPSLVDSCAIARSGWRCLSRGAQGVLANCHLRAMGMGEFD